MPDPITQSMIQGAAGAAGETKYIDDVFSNYLYKGLGTTANTIVNGLDMSASGPGGMTWIKNRTENHEHVVSDTVRGVNKSFFVNSNGYQNESQPNTINYFNNNGFGFDNSWSPSTNKANFYASWTFMKCENFFDIVTYTGNGSTSRNIAHNLGSTPGFIIVKRIDASADWSCYHRQMNLTGYTYQPANYYMRLNAQAAWQSQTDMWNNTMPTAQHFTVGDNTNVNANGGQYIAYIFAHNDGDGGFGGHTGTDGDIIQCAKYQGNGSTLKKVTVGWEPQYVLIKNIGDSGSGSVWLIYDAMRTAGRQNMYLNELRANTGDVEQDGAGYDSQPIISFDSDGFTLRSNSGYSNYNNHDYMYVAIRRPDGLVGKPVEAATDVFAMTTGRGGTNPNYQGGIVVDGQITRDIDSSSDWYTGARLIGNEYVMTNSSSGENPSSTWVYDWHDGYNTGSSGSDWQSWQWKRHAGFDVVTYDADQQVRQLPHSLGKAPEMMWIKSRNTGFNWKVYHKGANAGTNPEQYYFRLNHTDAQTSDSTMWNNTAPTSTVFTIGTAGGVNNSGSNYVAMLFASVDGISKVGYYTGNSGTISITTGFQPRFLIIKNITWQYGGWIVFDTLRGLGAGNDKYMYLNTNAAQATNQDFGDISSTGFSMGSGDSAVNHNNHNFIYYAHA